ncbi:hypothetical protein Tcan_09488 [Toxocara canis]|uniref:Uncharacterized protein n=1 Tax=Toxocara canis TaxID=6265 RepID=A0A0B2UX95_TOXCA|nr:hypothetical protein Tcan_09488 [Toxocara canis]
MEKREDDKTFLKIIEEYKRKKHTLECVCERRKCICLSTGAFWPPPREYYFFINNNKSMKGAEAAQKAEIKIRRATWFVSQKL